MAGHTWPNPTKINNLSSYLSVVTISKQKNKKHYLISSKDIDGDQSILQSDWISAFWPVTCETEFSQIWSLQSGYIVS